MKSLTPEEKQTIINAGWEFLNDEYIFIPDDEDGCMAYGIANIRKVLESIISRDVA